MRLALILALLASPALAQTISLTQPPPLAPGIAAFPKVEGDSPAAKSINAALGDNDADVKGSDCRAAPNFYTERSVKVTLAGPHYLAFLVLDGWYCPNNAHPGNAQTPFIFNLTTGNPMNPLNWLPPSLRPGPQSVTPWTEADFARIKPLTDLYRTLYKATPDDDCPQTLQTQPHRFNLWPDAATHSLVMQPTGLAYIFTPCLNPVSIPVATLRRLNFSPRLIAALATP